MCYFALVIVLGFKVKSMMCPLNNFYPSEVISVAAYNYNYMFTLCS
jgi:hypothetical protein